MTNTDCEKMKQKNMIVWILLLGIVVLLLSTSVQAKELTEVNATDILKQIENGEDVYIQNARITGELNLSKIELETVPIEQSVVPIMLGLKEELKIVESGITIKESVIENDVDFSNTQFRKSVDFTDITFSGKANFRGVSFCGDASFWNANFSDSVDFFSANFSRNAIFHSAIFSGKTFDWNRQTIWFGGLDPGEPKSDAIPKEPFGYVLFSGYAGFWNASFKGYASFRGTIFSCYYTNFGYASFDGCADFWSARFLSIKSEFTGANFGGGTDFEDASFEGYASFGGASSINCVDFTQTKFTKIRGAAFKCMKVDWFTFKEAIDHPDEGTYLNLMKNFRELEQFDDADAAYYQYRRLSQANKKWSYSKLGDVFIWATCGYGVKPHYTIGLGVIIILLFAFIYWGKNGIRRLKEIEGDDSRVSFWDAFYFSMITFTTVGYGDWYPIDKCRMFVMIEGLVGWLTLALFLVTLANVMIRP